MTAYNNLSSTTLFNFTDEFIHLKDALENGFYCGDIYEKLPFGENLGYKVPMVCFCDIPLGMIKHHLSWYGEYSIGINIAKGSNEENNSTFAFSGLHLFLSLKETKDFFLDHLTFEYAFEFLKLIKLHLLTEKTTIRTDMKYKEPYQVL